MHFLSPLLLLCDSLSFCRYLLIAFCNFQYLIITILSQSVIGVCDSCFISLNSFSRSFIWLLWEIKVYLTILIFFHNTLQISSTVISSTFSSSNIFNIPYSTTPHHSILLQVIVFSSSDIFLQLHIQANAFNQKVSVHLQLIDNQADI